MTIQLDTDKVTVLSSFLDHEELLQVGIKNLGSKNKEISKTAFILKDIALKVWMADQRKSKKMTITIVQALVLIEWLKNREGYILQIDHYKLNYTRELIRDLDSFITNYRE